MSSNTGKNPTLLVFSEVGTKFGAIGFDVDGRHLLYAAQHADGHAELHTIDVTDTTQAPVLWEGSVGWTVTDIQPGLLSGTVAWTTQTSCTDSIAMAQTPGGTVRALPDVAGPTRTVGWLGATQLLVATGGCGGPLDLSAVDLTTGSIVSLVSGVAIAAVRTPVPKPPAPGTDFRRGRRQRLRLISATRAAGRPPHHLDRRSVPRSSAQGQLLKAPAPPCRVTTTLVVRGRSKPV